MFSRQEVESALGCWKAMSYEPSPGDPLAAVVARIWLFDGTTAYRRERVFPDGTLEIVVQLDAQYRPVDAANRPGEPFPALSLKGVWTSAFVIEGPSTPVRVLGIRLRPLGAFSLLHTSPREMSDRDLDFNAVLGCAGEELGERCFGARSDAECIAATLAWIRGRISPRHAPPPAVVYAFAAIERSHGAHPISMLEGRSDASRGRLAAAFRDYVGVTPKRYARIARFRRALTLVAAGSAPLSAVAAEAGYYDQPHFTEEFRAHAGMTPRAYRDSLRYNERSTVDDSFFQDAPPPDAAESLYA